MKNKTTLVSLGLIALSLITYVGTILASQGLDKIRSEIKQDYDIAHVTNEELNQMSQNDIMIFDVRKAEEFSVSHIKDAILLNPRTSPDQFMNQYADQLKGKTLVFYCSVGQRSSSMLSRLNERLNEYKIEAAYNLDGGLFARHNTNLSLVKDGNPTRDIHPYNDYYGRLIDDKSGIRYE